MTANGPRRRRRPDEARREITRAAEGLFRARPSHEVTVTRIMEATTLSRKSFYVYFCDRYDLIASLVAPIRAERDAAVQELMDGDTSDREAKAGAAFVRLARLYARHGPLLGALAEAADRDEDARRAWDAFIEPLIAGHVRFIEEEVAAGRIAGIDPELTARVLIGMNLHAFLNLSNEAGPEELEVIANALLEVWIRTLYLQPGHTIADMP